MFAIEGVLDIAYNSGMRPVQSIDVTTRQAIPRRYLEPVLQQLVRTGILEGVRGPRGGYRLGRDRSQISLADIAEAVRSTETASDPFDLPTDSPLGQDIVRPLCLSLVTSWNKQLESITIEDLCRRADEAGIRSDTEVVSDLSA